VLLTRDAIRFAANEHENDSTTSERSQEKVLVELDGKKLISSTAATTDDDERSANLFEHRL
jgi:hypothetical protein